MHAKRGMTNVITKRCAGQGCTKFSSYGFAEVKTAQFCAQHAKDGMVEEKICAHEGCDKKASFGVAGGKTAQFCCQHAQDGMVKVSSKKCAHQGCTKGPSFGVAGGKTAHFCSQHAKRGMVNVTNKRCTYQGCRKVATHDVAGGNTAQFCSQHAKRGMMDVKSKRCTRQGCPTRSSFGMEGIQTEKFCARHSQHGMLDTKHSERRSSENDSASDGSVCGSPAVRDGTERAFAAAGKKKRGRLPSSTQTETVSGRCRGGTKRPRQTHVVRVAPTSTDRNHEGRETPTPSEDVLLLERVNAAMNTEVGVSSKVNITEKFKVESGADEQATSAGGDSWLQQNDAFMKTEVGISPPPTGTTVGGALDTIAVASVKPIIANIGVAFFKPMIVSWAEKVLLVWQTAVVAVEWQPIRTRNANHPPCTSIPPANNSGLPDASFCHVSVIAVPNRSERDTGAMGLLQTYCGVNLESNWSMAGGRCAARSLLSARLKSTHHICAE